MPLLVPAWTLTWRTGKGGMPKSGAHCTASPLSPLSLSLSSLSHRLLLRRRAWPSSVCQFVVSVRYLKPRPSSPAMAASAATAAASVTNRNGLMSTAASFAARHHRKFGLASSSLPPLRPPTGLQRTPPPRLAPFSPRRPLHISAALAQTASPAEPPGQQASASIWLSDVTPVWKKPTFLNRNWTAYDVFVAVYLAVTHGACLLAPFCFTWKALGVFFTMYIVTGLLGITLSFHRNLAHKSFTLPKWLEYTFAYFGSLALQGDPLEWVSSHRCHHQHCDTEMDPHTPYAGFWHSHVGWVLDNNLVAEKVGSRSNVADLAKQPFYRFLQKTYSLHGILWGVILYAWGGLPFLIWGGPVRICWVYHITWLVNSASHVWGYQAWNTGDLSKNNWWVALLAFGEGWHNNHHAFEYSARHGLEWWEFDLTWYFIFALEKLGLATNVKLPTNEHKKRLALNAS